MENAHQMLEGSEGGVGGKKKSFVHIHKKEGFCQMHLSLALLRLLSHLFKNMRHNVEACQLCTAQTTMISRTRGKRGGGYFA